MVTSTTLQLIYAINLHVLVALTVVRPTYHTS